MNYNAEMPIYLQVIHDLKKKMIQGKILPGEKLPSNRELAVLYKINQNTAARIYREMETHGYCYTKRDWNICDGGRDDVRDDKKRNGRRIVEQLYT